MSNTSRFHIAFVFCVMLGVFVAGCSKKQITIPEDTIRTDTMVSILTEIHLAQAAVSTNVAGDSVRFTTGDYLPSIFKKYHTTQQQFDKTLRFYSGNPMLLDSIYKEVLDELSRKEGEIEAQVKSGQQ